MTFLDLNKLEKLSEMATPGPWFVRQLDDDYCMSAITVSTKPDTAENKSWNLGDWPTSEIVAGCLIQHPRYVDPADGRWEENAALIAAMRSVLPELIKLARIGLSVQSGQTEA
ncbi:hypothetical protein [Asticcacaulis sp.]|uniref:hypothetical protein n=1 Tax=Asticcacaulis sp. TaxID=1872648 RepID=UPI002626A358|nr:hypothetical protein [Asticcacaulis sp.]